ncbi:hypothetical protein NHX12_013808, partial [Muraenolepis orangiensis]
TASPGWLLARGYCVSSLGAEFGSFVKRPPLGTPPDIYIIGMQNGEKNRYC